LKAVTELYAEAFPEQLRVRLGEQACSHYITSVANDTNYRILVVRDGDRVLGFCIMKLDALLSPSRSWVWGCWPFVLRGVLRAPGFWLGEALHRITVRLRHTPSPPNAGTRETHRAQDEPLSYLDFIGVSKEARRQGLARLLVAECIRVAGQEAHSAALRLTVKGTNQAALRFYESMGFQSVSYSAESDSYNYEMRFNCACPG